MNANLKSTNLLRAILFRADLVRADLSGTDLMWADLSEADLSKAILVGATLSGADLSTASLTQEELEPATGDENTRLPPDLNPPRTGESRLTNRLGRIEFQRGRGSTEVLRGRKEYSAKEDVNLGGSGALDRGCATSPLRSSPKFALARSRVLIGEGPRRVLS